MYEKITVAELAPEHIGRVIRSYTTSADRSEGMQVSVLGTLEYVLHDPQGMQIYDAKEKPIEGQFQPAVDQLKIGGVTFSFPHHIVIEVF